MLSWSFQSLECQWREGSFDKSTATHPLQFLTEEISMVVVAGAFSWEGGRIFLAKLRVHY